MWETFSDIRTHQKQICQSPGTYLSPKDSFPSDYTGQKQSAHDSHKYLHDAGYHRNNRITHALNAAPAIPIFNFTTKSRSRMILPMEAMIIA